MTSKEAITILRLGQGMFGLAFMKSAISNEATETTLDFVKKFNEAIDIACTSLETDEYLDIEGGKND